MKTIVRRNTETSRRPVLAAAATFLLLLSITISMWWNASAETTRIAHERFEFKVDEGQFAIEQRLLAYEQVLRGAIALFAASSEVTRDEWRAYVDQLKLEKNFPGIQGMAFSQRILPDQVTGHVRTLRSEGFPDYAIRPSGERAEYVPVVYIEPFDWRNRRAIGFDLFSEPVRREALLRARNTGLPSVTGKIKLAQETNEGVQNGFLMCMPVFPKGSMPAAVEERPAALIGNVCSVFRMNDLLRGIFGPEKLPNIRLQIFDGAAVTPESLMYDSLEKSSETNAAVSAFTVDQAFEFNGRTWTLRFSSLPSFDATIDLQKPRLVLFSGLLVTMLFTAVVWSLSLNRRRARELADVNRGLEAEIAERTKLEVALKYAKDAAESANEAKSEFLANVSHELRTPLTLILAPLDQLLAAGGPPGDWHKQLERAHRNALMLFGRVNDILDFSKAEAGKAEVRCEAVDLVEQVSALAEDAAAVAAAKGSSLEWNVDAALNQVCLDRTHFEKIFLNLISNALKFTPSGGWIRVDVKPLDHEWFELSVADSGIGIRSDKLPLLFKRFEQADASVTRQHGGTGIGLALVKELAQLMGGTVGVESEFGNGARFFVRLKRNVEPMAISAGVADMDAGRARSASDVHMARIRLAEGNYGAAAADTNDAYPRDTGLPTVLVVDDNRDMRAYVAELLQDECNVVCAADGQQAWEWLQHHPADVIVSDVMMPNLDGFGLTARVKASVHHSHIPVILVTARGGIEASVSGLQSGADDYVTKPFAPSELKARVRAALRMSQVQVQLRDKSREAGMAVVATGILHNLGNALNGVTVFSTVILDKLRESKLAKLRKVAELLRERSDDLPAFIAHDRRGRLLPGFITELSQHLDAEHAGLLKEAEGLKACAEHAAGVIASQQNCARPRADLREMMSASELFETALTLRRGTLEEYGIAIARDYTYMGCAAGDRHKVLQILLNILSNAGHAVRDADQAEKRIEVRTVLAADRVRLEVSDNGRGINPAHLPFLFNFGFTTKKAEGNGLGLHSSANWAREMGGSLTCRSDGEGRGATFILELPGSLPDERSNRVEHVATALAS